MQILSGDTVLIKRGGAARIAEGNHVQIALCPPRLRVLDPIVQFLNAETRSSRREGAVRNEY